MAISYVGSATGTNTATPPTHQAGDLLVVFAYRDGSTTNPTLGSGATQITAPDGTSCSVTAGYFIATAPGTSIGTWTNATSVICHVYRSSTGSVFPGASATNAGTTTTINYPALTLNNTSGTSWVAGFVGISSTDTAAETAPSGMTNRSTVNDATDEAAGHDTNGGVASWSSTNVSAGGTNGNWVSVVVEIAESPITYLGANASTTTTVTVPTHQAGDLILIFAFNRGSLTIPTLPSGYTNKTTITSGSAANAAVRVGYKIATSSSETSGTWTSADQLVCHVYRGVDQTTPLGTLGSSTYATQLNLTVVYPTITLSVTNGTSWVAAFGGSNATDSAIDTAPAGMVQRATATGALSEVAGFDTYGGRASWSQQTVAIGGADNEWIAVDVEIVALASVSVTVTPTGESATGSTNSVTVAIPKTVTVTGETATGSTNSVAVTGSAVVTPTGESATGSTNSVTVALPITVAVTGETATGSTNDVTVTGAAVVAVTGETATGITNDVIASGAIPVTGETATGSTNDVTVTGAANVAVTGETATGATNSVTVQLITPVDVTGETATGSTNSVTVTGNALVTVTGETATGSVNSVTVSVPQTVLVTGEAATGTVNSVTVLFPTVVYATGVTASGSVGNVFINLGWDIIDTTQTANWQQISTTQTTNWTDVQT